MFFQAPEPSSSCTTQCFSAHLLGPTGGLKNAIKPSTWLFVTVGQLSYMKGTQDTGNQNVLSPGEWKRVWWSWWWKHGWQAAFAVKQYWGKLTWLQNQSKWQCFSVRMVFNPASISCMCKDTFSFSSSWAKKGYLFLQRQMTCCSKSAWVWNGCRLIWDCL